MICGLKKRIHIFFNRMTMLSEFYHDYKDYKYWNYNRPNIKTQCSWEAKILRQTHVIEKGLSLSNPRKGFGMEKIKELFQMMDNYIALKFSTRSIPFQNAIHVLNQYVCFQKNIGFEDMSLNQKLLKYQKYLETDFPAGIAHTTLEQIKKERNSIFPEFFNSRHSIRQFADKEIDFTDIEKAVKMARKAPTACNRQACKVYFYTDPYINQQLGNLIPGNTGFDNEVKNYLVITSNISAFYDAFERNQLYIEAGIFTMALIQSLHYYGIASCVLQNGEYHKKNKKFKHICNNIPENEKIVLFIAIGYYKEEFNYAISKRKNVEDILIKK